MSRYAIVSDKHRSEIDSSAKTEPIFAVLILPENGNDRVICWNASLNAAKNAAKSHPALASLRRNGIAYTAEVVPVVKVGA